MDIDFVARGHVAVEFIKLDDIQVAVTLIAGLCIDPIPIRFCDSEYWDVLLTACSLSKFTLCAQIPWIVLLQVHNRCMVEQFQPPH